MLASVIGLASPAFASGQYCTNNAFSECTGINGSGTIINWAQGTATSDAALPPNGQSLGETNCPAVDAHIELVGPTGNELCNSNTYAITGPGIKMTCTWQGGGREYRAGNYCTIVWAWVYHGGFGGGFYYQEQGTNACVYVS